MGYIAQQFSHCFSILNIIPISGQFAYLWGIIDIFSGISSDIHAKSVIIKGIIDPAHR